MEKNYDGELSHVSVWLSYVVFVSSAWKHVGMTISSYVEILSIYVSIFGI